MPRAKEIFPYAILGTRAIGSPALARHSKVPYIFESVVATM